MKLLFRVLETGKDLYANDFIIYATFDTVY
jgi:hypothetical protein